MEKLHEGPMFHIGTKGGGDDGKQILIICVMRMEIETQSCDAALYHCAAVTVEYIPKLFPQI
jgi:hypothetical protein